jgi:hypothetical protein
MLRHIYSINVIITIFGQKLSLEGKFWWVFCIGASSSWQSISISSIYCQHCQQLQNLILAKFHLFFPYISAKKVSFAESGHSVPKSDIRRGRIFGPWKTLDPRWADLRRCVILPTAKLPTVKMLTVKMSTVKMSTSKCWPSKCWPSKCWPSKCWPSKCRPSKCWPSKCQPSKCQPSKCWRQNVNVKMSTSELYIHT